MKILADKSIAIVGASGGIGKGIISTLHEAGAYTIAMGRRLDRLVELADSASSHVLFDLEAPDGWNQAIETIPPLDGIVIASGKLDLCPFRALKPESFSTAMGINVVSPVALLRSLARSGRLKSGCSIVFIGSIAGIRGAMGHLAYSACKSALHGVVRTLALELASQRIRVNLVSPGLVLAGMGTSIGTAVTHEQIQEYAKKYPLGLGRPCDVAGPVAFLLSSAAGWITGQDIVTDGGATLS